MASLGSMRCEERTPLPPPIAAFVPIVVSAVLTFMLFHWYSALAEFTPLYRWSEFFIVRCAVTLSLMTCDPLCRVFLATSFFMFCREFGRRLRPHWYLDKFP